MTVDDRERVREFIDALGGEVAHVAIGERKMLGLGHGDPVTIAEIDGEVRAALFLSPGRLPTVEVAALPGDEEIAGLLFAEVVDRHTALRAWTLGDRWRTVLLDAGFEQERTLHRLEVELPVDSTEVHFAETGFSVEDLEEWLVVNNLAFAGHPEQGDWTKTDFRERMELPWWDPDDLRMAWDGETLVGSCWTKVHADGTGEIYVIGLRPDYWGRGWGKELVLEGLRHLHAARDCRRGMLYVDAANVAAKATYERIGFRTTSIDRSYVRRDRGMSAETT